MSRQKFLFSPPVFFSFGAAVEGFGFDKQTGDTNDKNGNNFKSRCGQPLPITTTTTTRTTTLQQQQVACMRASFRCLSFSLGV